MRYIPRILLASLISLIFGCEERSSDAAQVESPDAHFQRLSSDLVKDELDSGRINQTYCPVFVRPLRTGSGVEDCVILGVFGWPENSGIVLRSDEAHALVSGKLSTENQLWLTLSGKIVRNEKFDEIAQIGPEDTAVAFLSDVKIHGWSYAESPELIPSKTTKGKPRGASPNNR